MKVFKYLCAMSILCAVQFLNAVHREFFVEDIFIEEIPVSHIGSYYDDAQSVGGGEFENWFNGPYAFGNAFGIRPNLKNTGLCPLLRILAILRLILTAATGRARRFQVP